MFLLKSKRGFTLIELLVVISIISLLTSLSFSYLGDAKQKGRDTEKIRAMIEVRKALQMYVTEKGYFPGSNDFTIELINSNYIPSVNTGIIYKGLYSNGIECSNEPCDSYHMGIRLERADNKVLDSDASSNDYFNGESTDCGYGAGTDLCYDLVS